MHNITTLMLQTRLYESRAENGRISRREDLAGHPRLEELWNKDLWRGSQEEISTGDDGNGDPLWGTHRIP